MATNLLEVLTKEDKDLMKRYMELYGAAEGCVCDIDHYLRYWAKCKTKLYHLLGDQLQVKIPYKKEMPNDIKKSMWYSVTQRHTQFLSNFLNMMDSFCRKYEFPSSEDQLSLVNIMMALKDADTWIDDKIGYGCKFQTPDGKTFQIAKTMKPIKVITKLMDFTAEYRKESYYTHVSEKNLEKFRVIHSIWKTDHILQGNLVLSIHPLDYITMSDNASNWQSCMNWQKEGCFRLGTVEMMNSNNVICVYLESTSVPFVFDKKNGLKWNNKKWRELFYVTKDIILGGEQYPYTNNLISADVLSTLRQLARDNMHWGYEFGPELYKDMNNINTLYTIDKIKDWIADGSAIKNNIIFDTYAMYNDLMHKNNHYYCVRNKVKKNKVISVSGKQVCACCGKEDFHKQWGYDYYDDDDSRDSNPAEVVCGECLTDHSCDICSAFAGTSITVRSVNGKDIMACKKCIDRNTVPCACCGELVYVGGAVDARDLVAFKTPYYHTELKYENFCEHANIQLYGYRYMEMSIEEYFKTIEPPVLYGVYCLDCKEKMVEQKQIETALHPAIYSWNFNNKLFFSVDTFTLDELLQHPEYSKALVWHKMLD